MRLHRVANTGQREAAPRGETRALSDQFAAVYCVAPRCTSVLSIALRCVALPCLALPRIALRSNGDVGSPGIPTARSRSPLCNAVPCVAMPCFASLIAASHCSALLCLDARRSAINPALFAVRCTADHSRAVHRRAEHCFALPCTAVQSGASRCNALLSLDAPSERGFRIGDFSAVPCIPLHRAALPSSALPIAAHPCSAQHCPALHCIAEPCEDACRSVPNPALSLPCKAVLIAALRCCALRDIAVLCVAMLCVAKRSLDARWSVVRRIQHSRGSNAVS